MKCNEENCREKVHKTTSERRLVDFRRNGGKFSVIELKL